MASDAVASDQERRSYRNPPVHEVVLDYQFQEPFLSGRDLEELKTAAGEKFGAPARAEVFELRGGVGSSGSNIQSRTQFAGWDFTVPEPRWLLRTYQDRLTLHLARPGELPQGEYLGWEAVRERYGDVHGFMSGFYGETHGRRAALRYLNRIVVPAGSDLGKWFNIVPPAPDFLQDTHTFHIARTWQTVNGHPGFSASVRLAKLQLGSEQVPEAAYPVLLDVEVFNLWVRNAPDYNDLPTWFEEAHAIENRIFETSVTDQLRGRFE